MTRLLFFLCLFCCTLIKAQSDVPSIHEEQLMYYNSTGNTSSSYYEEKHIDIVNFQKMNCNLEKIVYGWHPYWVGSAYQNYQWNLLSHFSFFSYEVNASDGQPLNTHGWSTSAAVDAALASGNTKVTLCVTLFSGHSTFFASATAQQTLITNLINLVQSRGAHGVNIDFEGLPSAQAINFANFMVNLSNQMHTAIPNSEVSTVLYAVDWNNVFDFTIMEPYVDHYIIMGYAYYYSGSSTAGPTDPLYHFGTTYNYTLSRSITYYMDKGCPKDKLVLGLPNYGYEWPTSTLNVPSTTTGSGTARTYAYVRNNTSGNYSVANHIWETNSYSDVFAFNSGANTQCIMSMDSSWAKRLEHVRRTGIAGIGIWALGYDNGYTELWDVMSAYLTDCYEDPCSGTIHDFGGPTRDYYDDENYTWTIAPPNASSLNIDFSMFDVELNYDYLFIYDGPDENAVQIPGSPFTGTTGPVPFTTSTGSVTFKFTSDGATVTPGFLGSYSCNSVAPPVAGFSYGALEICAGDSVALINTSTDADVYSWSSSSGSLSDPNEENPNLFPSSSGNYTITLTVDNVSGTDQITQILDITVNEPPIADAVPSSTQLTLPNAAVFFTNNSSNANEYLWEFGDGSTSTDQSPWHDYLSNGSFDGYLIAMNIPCPNDTSFFTINVGLQNLDFINHDIISVTPNPFNNFITVPSGLSIEEITLKDVKGRVVASEWDSSSQGMIVKTTNLAGGIYFLKIQISGEVFEFKLMKN